jgi:hypothetical protein
MPDQGVTNKIWLWIVATFAAVLIDTMLALIGAIFVGFWRKTDAATLQILLTVFTTSAGILAGFISAGRAAAAAVLAPRPTTRVLATPSNDAAGITARYQTISPLLGGGRYASAHACHPCRRLRRGGSLPRSVRDHSLTLTFAPVIRIESPIAAPLRSPATRPLQGHQRAWSTGLALEQHRCFCPEGGVSCRAVGVTLVTASPKKQSRRRRGSRCSFWAIATTPRVCRSADSLQARPSLCVGIDRFESRTASITALSLGEAERSSRRCRHTRCSGSSTPEARIGRSPVPAFLAEQ